MKFVNLFYCQNLESVGLSEIVLNPISTGGGGGVFHPMPSKWLRTLQRNKLAPSNLVTFQNWVLAKFSIL